jgi:hypothetical protein
MPMIERIQIFGERCSGTNYLENLITSNFKDIEITWDYGWKHWFPENIDKKDNDDCLFIVLFRNPYDWLSSLHHTPWHVDKTLKDLTFSKFIRTEWKCVYDIYSGLEERFKNVLEMRNYKVREFLALEKKVLNYTRFRYEDLRDNPNVLKNLSIEFKLKMKDDDIAPYKNYKKTKQTYKPPKYEPINMVDRFYIRKSLDLKQEKSIGYNPRIIF